MHRSTATLTSGFLTPKYVNNYVNVHVLSHHTENENHSICVQLRVFAYIHL